MLLCIIYCDYTCCCWTFYSVSRLASWLQLLAADHPFLLWPDILPRWQGFTLFQRLLFIRAVLPEKVRSKACLSLTLPAGRVCEGLHLRGAGARVCG